MSTLLPSAPVVRVLPYPDDAAEAAALHIAEALRTAPEGAPLVLGVSGGSSVTGLYTRLATLDVPWARLHVVWIDERHVPPDDERSNERLVRESLLVGAPVPPENVHPYPTHLAPDEAAGAYDATLRALLGDAGLTVAVMGIGADGHTASLFPGADLDAHGRLAAHTLAPPTSPVTDRLTLTLDTINRSRHAVFLATGESKAGVIARALGDPPPCPTLPAACVRGAETTVWFVDEAAHPA